MSVKKWLAENDIKEKAYYYWLRKFRKEAYNQMQLPAPETATTTEITFAEVTMPVPIAGPDTTSVNVPDISPTAVIKCNGLTIELSNSISGELLSRLLQEVVHA